MTIRESSGIPYLPHYGHLFFLIDHLQSLEMLEMLGHEPLAKAHLFYALFNTSCNSHVPLVH